MYDQVKHNKDKLKMDDYLSALMDHSKNLRSNIDIYNDKLKSINSKLSMVTHTPNFIYKKLVFFSIKMGKTEAKNLDLKSKLSIVSSTIANAKKDIESFKTEFNDFKSDHAMSKKGLNSLKNEFYDYLIKSLKVNDNLIKLNDNILMTKNEYYLKIKNMSPIINNDTLINKTNCIKLKSLVRENINSLKNIKNNYYNIKKDNINLSIDFKKLKEEYINKSNKSESTIYFY